MFVEMPEGAEGGEARRASVKGLYGPMLELLGEEDDVIRGKVSSFRVFVYGVCEVFDRHSGGLG